MKMNPQINSDVVNSIEILMGLFLLEKLQIQWEKAEENRSLQRKCETLMGGGEQSGREGREGPMGEVGFKDGNNLWVGEIVQQIGLA